MPVNLGDFPILKQKNFSLLKKKDAFSRKTVTGKKSGLIVVATRQTDTGNIPTNRVFRAPRHWYCTI
jgi:hypothetical protein